MVGFTFLYLPDTIWYTKLHRALMDICQNFLFVLIFVHQTNVCTFPQKAKSWLLLLVLSAHAQQIYLTQQFKAISRNLSCDQWDKVLRIFILQKIVETTFCQQNIGLLHSAFIDFQFISHWSLEDGSLVQDIIKP